MKILENSTGGSSIGNNKEVQTARAKNVYRQTQNFDHRHNKGRTTKAQKRKNNKDTTKVEQSRIYNFWAATDNVRFIKWIFFLRNAVMMYWQIFSHPCLKVPDTTL